MEIWLRQNGEDYGPYTLVQIKEYIASGEVSLEDEAWFDGCDDYLPVADIPGLKLTRKLPGKLPVRKSKKPVIWVAVVCGIILTAIVSFAIVSFVKNEGEKEVADEKQSEEETPNKAPVRKLSNDELEYREGIRYVKGETEPFTGTEIWYHKDGTKMEETPYVDGEIHGKYMAYHEDGSKMSEAYYNNGKLHGTSTRWINWWREETPYVNGKKHGKEITYKDRKLKWSVTPYVNDKKHGMVIGFHKNGSKRSEIPYVDGKKHGTEIDYREDGSKVHETIYENGKFISRKFP